MNITNVFQAEFRKYILEIQNYYPDYVGNLVTTYIFFMGIFYLASPNSNDLSQSLVGFLIWFFSVNVISEASATISEEKQIGTLEQILLKPVGILQILIVRSICWTFIGTVENIFLFLMIFLTTGLTFDFQIELLPVIVLTLIGLYGFGLALAGLTILFTKTASFSSILQYFLLFFTGSVAKLEQFPIVIQWIARSLPLTNGIELSQKIIAEKLTWFNIFQENIFWILLMSSFIYAICGMWFFSKVYKIARKKGLTRRY